MDVRRRFLDDYVEGSGGSYTLTLNSQWQESTTVSNPDSTLYDGVYESYSNYNVNSGVAIMYIDITGYSDFKLYIRSYGESNYDYVMVSQLDKTITGSSSYSDTSLVKAHTRGNQQSGTALSNYTLVEFSNIDGGSHRITVLYRKDGSAHSGTDKGYLFIPKSQVSDDSGDSGGGDVDIDTTYSITYTSTDGNKVTPKKSFSANILSHSKVGDEWVISFDASTDIPASTFEDATTLKTVEMIGISALRNYAFDGCTNLTSVILPEGLIGLGINAFYGCSKLQSITIPSGLSSIGQSAFSGCSSLRSVSIPNSVKTIYSSAFENCTSLNSISTQNVTSIGYSAFENCTSLRSISIQNATSIGDAVFKDCSNLTSVTMPSTMNTYLEGNIFNDCTSLKTITIPNGCTGIDSQCFIYCESLSSINIPSSVTFIETMAFLRCYSLSKVYITDLSSWCKIIFNSNPCEYGHAKIYLNNTILSDVVIPDDVTEIKYNAFEGCSSITSVTIHDGVTDVGIGAFSQCSSLSGFYGKFASADHGCLIVDGVVLAFAPVGHTVYSIPNDATSIHSDAFYYCESLSEITIPSSVTKIGDMSFRECSSLVKVYCKSTTPPTLGHTAFGGNASSRTIYVPTSSVDAYKAASGWSTYADYIVGYDF